MFLNAIAFPLCNATDILWNRNMVSCCSLVTSEILLPTSEINLLLLLLVPSVVKISSFINIKLKSNLEWLKFGVILVNYYINTIIIIIIYYYYYYYYYCCYYYCFQVIRCNWLHSLLYIFTEAKVIFKISENKTT